MHTKISFKDKIIQTILYMSKIEINSFVYHIHSVYDLYAANESGDVINIVKREPIEGNKKSNGYIMCSVRKHAQKGQKSYYVHRFVWECFNGIIPDNKVIDHINNNRNDNRLCNLQLVTQQENCKKSAQERDYTFVAKNHQNKKCVKAIDCETKEVSYYNSMYAIQQHLGINAGVVKMVCEKINGCKTGISKIDNHSYEFEYVDKQDMPDNYKKSANRRSNRVPVEDKKKHKKEAMKRWQQKEYECPKCGKTYKNGYRYVHNKICE